MKFQTLIRKVGFATIFSGFLSLMSIAQTKPNAPELVAGIPVNYEEANVKPYALPDPLVHTNGKVVNSAEDWIKRKRPEILDWYQRAQFGKAPGIPAGFRAVVTDQGTPVFGGKAIRKQVTLYLYEKSEEPKIDLALYLPAQQAGPAPVLVRLSFFANATTIDDSDLQKDSVWNSKEKIKVAAASFRQDMAFPVEEFIEAGIGVVSLYYGDIEPDFKEGIQYGIRSRFLPHDATTFAADEWGAISAWAWGLSRVMDYLEKDKDVDSKKVAINGHSRLGKTVLYAGANDPRFSIVIPSCSGEGGAALSRRNYGETIAHLVAPTRYAYQFSANYSQYQDDPSTMEVDSHMLISLIAPRPILLITGDSDKWSDPKGEFLAAVAAGPVYRLFGKKDLGTDTLPPLDKPILHDVGFLIHKGGHQVLPQDIHTMITFMKKHWLNTAPAE